MKRVQVQLKVGKILTYQTDLPVRMGSNVFVPPPFWSDRYAPPQEGKVIDLNSDYEGPCVDILSIKKRQRCNA